MAFYKVRIAMDAAIKKIPSVATNSLGHRWIPLWEGVAGVIQQRVNHDVRVDGTAVYSGMTAILTLADARKLASRIDNLNNGSDHLTVKTNVDWQAAYGLQNRDVDFIDTTGILVTPKRQESTLPCHNCGLVLPLDCVQVDHFMPQTGGEDLYTLKMLRGLGLTASGPSGAKGGAIFGNTGFGSIYPKGRARGDYHHLTIATPTAKWNTNDRGIAFLSLIQLAGALDDLRRACKNSTLNLVPLCGACNREKSDWIRPIQ